MNIIGFWVTYAVLAVPVFALLFLWALRAGQFKDQERARSLPFHDDLRPEANVGRPGVFSWAPLLVIVFVAALMIAAAWISVTHPPQEVLTTMAEGQ